MSLTCPMTFLPLCVPPNNASSKKKKIKRKEQIDFCNLAKELYVYDLDINLVLILMTSELETIHVWN